MQQVLALFAAALLLIPVFMVSAVLFVVVLLLGLVGFAWFWWSTRVMRRELRARMTAQQAVWEVKQQQEGSASGVIIEGEVVREQEKLP